MKTGFTIFELVLVLTILGIMTAAGTVFFGPMIQLYFYTPEATTTQLVATTVIDDVMEGRPTPNGVSGLRVMTRIRSASATQVAYTDENNVATTLNWDSTAKAIKRSLGASVLTLPTQFPSANVLLDGQTSGVLFQYFTSTNVQLGVPVGTPVSIARVQMDWVFYTGTVNAQVSRIDSTHVIHTGVMVKQY
jgi:prepilin-type N-terminal cleavage/methylation domain-containing protein